MILNNSLKVANSIIELLWGMEPTTGNFVSDELVVEPFRNQNTCGLSITNVKKNLRVNIQAVSRNDSDVEIRYGKANHFTGNAGPNMFKTNSTKFNFGRYEAACKFCLTYLYDGSTTDVGNEEPEYIYKT